MRERPLHVVVLAAGQGRRMRSALPKPLLPLAGRPLLLHVLRGGRGPLSLGDPLGPRPGRGRLFRWSWAIGQDCSGCSRTPARHGPCRAGGFALDPRERAGTGLARRRADGLARAPQASGRGRGPARRPDRPSGGSRGLWACVARWRRAGAGGGRGARCRSGGACQPLGEHRHHRRLGGRALALAHPIGAQECARRVLL